MEPDASKSNAIFAGVSHNFGLAGNFGVEPGVNYVFNFRRPVMICVSRTGITESRSLFSSITPLSLQATSLSRFSQGRLPISDFQTRAPLMSEIL